MQRVRTFIAACGLMCLAGLSSCSVGTQPYNPAAAQEHARRFSKEPWPQGVDTSRLASMGSEGPSCSEVCAR
jgi:hypothetical protein